MQENEKEEKELMERYTGYMAASLINAVREEAKRDNRSFNYTMSYLVAQAMKEKERLRAKKKKPSVSEQGA